MAHEGKNARIGPADVRQPIGRAEDVSVAGRVTVPLSQELESPANPRRSPRHKPALYTPERMNAVLPRVATKGGLTADFPAPTATEAERS